MKNINLQAYLSLSIKLILIISILNAINNQFWYIMSTNIFILILMFIPSLIKKYQIKIPKGFEWSLLGFAIFTLFLGKITGIIVPIIFGLAIAFIGFIILAILYSSNQIKKNYFLIIIFSFNFSVTFGFILELLKYYLKIILRISINTGDYMYSMHNMSFVVLGAAIASTIGYVYMKSKRGFIRKFIGKIAKKNPKIFLKKIHPLEEILNLIKNGENEKVEFKSTLRMNLHTKKIDKKIELATLKTLTAFFNSKGGTLLIGIKDDGRISGIEKDKFENDDKFNLHLTNLIKEKIGKKYLYLISIQTIKIKNKTIVKIECKKSDDPIFLKLSSNEEEFYIRSGPASIQTKGSELVEYISKRFEKK